MYLENKTFDIFYLQVHQYVLQRFSIHLNIFRNQKRLRIRPHRKKVVQSKNGSTFKINIIKLSMNKSTGANTHTVYTNWNHNCI